MKTNSVILRINSLIIHQRALKKIKNIHKIVTFSPLFIFSQNSFYQKLWKSLHIISLCIIFISLIFQLYFFFSKNYYFGEIVMNFKSAAELMLNRVVKTFELTDVIKYKDRPYKNLFEALAQYPSKGKNNWSLYRNNKNLLRKQNSMNENKKDESSMRQLQ